MTIVATQSPFSFRNKSRDKFTAWCHMAENLIDWVSECPTIIFRMKPKLITWEDDGGTWYEYRFRAMAFDRDGNPVPPPFVPAEENFPAREVKSQ